MFPSFGGCGFTFPGHCIPPVFWGSSRTPHPLFSFFDEAADLLSGFIISHYIEKGKRNFQFFSQKDGNGRFSKFFMDLSFCCKVPFSLYFLHPFALTVAREHFFHWKPFPITPDPAGRGGPGRWRAPVSQGQKVLSPHRQVPYGEAGSLGKDLPGQDFQPLEPLQPCAICRSQAGGIPRCMASRSKKRSGPSLCSQRRTRWGLSSRTASW